VPGGPLGGRPWLLQGSRRITDLPPAAARHRDPGQPPMGSPRAGPAGPGWCRPGSVTPS